jgi:hypothetical protein
MEQSHYVEDTSRSTTTASGEARQLRPGAAELPVPKRGRSRVAAPVRADRPTRQGRLPRAPTAIAYPDKRDTDAAYARLLGTALRSERFTAIATHDDKLISHAIGLAKELCLPRDRFAFQVLYGIRARAQLDLARSGYREVVTAPLWIRLVSYLLRRLAERPATPAFLLRHAIRG